VVGFISMCLRCLVLCVCWFERRLLRSYTRLLFTCFSSYSDILIYFILFLQDDLDAVFAQNVIRMGEKYTGSEMGGYSLCCDVQCFILSNVNPIACIIIVTFRLLIVLLLLGGSGAFGNGARDGHDEEGEIDMKMFKRQVLVCLCFLV
jgi:hypothetical protein